MVFLGLLSGCTSLPWMSPADNQAAQALDKAQTENASLQTEGDQLSKALEMKKSELSALRATAQ